MQQGETIDDVFGGPRHRTPYIVKRLALMLGSALLLAAAGAFSWDIITARGSTADARRAVWQGDDLEQRQAVVALYEDALRSIETLKAKAGAEPGQVATQARIALQRLGEHLR